MEDRRLAALEPSTSGIDPVLRWFQAELQDRIEQVRLRGRDAVQSMTGASIGGAQATVLQWLHDVQEILRQAEQLEGREGADILAEVRRFQAGIPSLVAIDAARRLRAPAARG